MTSPSSLLSLSHERPRISRVTLDYLTFSARRSKFFFEKKFLSSSKVIISFSNLLSTPLDPALVLSDTINLGFTTLNLLKLLELRYELYNLDIQLFIKR